MKTKLYRLLSDEEEAESALPPEEEVPWTPLREASPESEEAQNDEGLPARERAGIETVREPESPRLTRAEVSSLIDQRLGGLRIYVLESDITKAQQSVKTLVEMATF